MAYENLGFDLTYDNLGLRDFNPRPREITKGKRLNLNRRFVACRVSCKLNMNDII